MSKLDELRDAAAYVADELRSIHADNGDNDLDAETQARFDEGVAFVTETKAQIEKLEARAAAVESIEDVVRTAPASVASGDGATSAPAFHRDVNPYDEDTIRSIGVGEAFKRAVGTIDTRGLDADNQQELERKAVLEAMDPQHMGGFREYVLNLGSEDYARGWFKKVTGQAHRMTDAEVYADERAARFVSQRAIAIASDAVGAALVPVHLDPTVIKSGAGSRNPFRAISKQVSIMQNVWNGVSSAGVAFVSSTEGGDTTNGAPTFVDPSITCAKPHCTVPISFEAYDDIANIGSIVSEMFSDAKDDYENAQFATGNGTNNPIGIVTALVSAGAGRQSNHATNSAFTVTDLINAQNALAARFQGGASWAGSLTYHNRVRAFGTDYYSQSVDLTQAAAGQWLGKPAYEASGMTTALSTASNYALVYGDFSNYVIVDRVGMSVEFVPHLFSSAGAGILPNGKRAWHAWYRVGADSANDSGFILSVNGAA